MTSPSVQLRRKPRQSRAKQTQQALLDSVVRLLQQQSPAQLTIREITELADTVSELRPVKHAFDAGIKAQMGIDY